MAGNKSQNIAFAIANNMANFGPKNMASRTIYMASLLATYNKFLPWSKDSHRFSPTALPLKALFTAHQSSPSNAQTWLLELA